MSFDLVNQLLLAVNEAALVRSAFLRYLQTENQCTCTFGTPCHSHKCACAIEMQEYIDKASAHPPASQGGAAP